MPEAWQIGDWLVVDAAGPEVRVGWMAAGEWRTVETCQGGALESLSKTCARLLAVDGELRTAGGPAGFLYGEGPGSTLGLRVAAMLLRSWMALPAFANVQLYRFLHLEVALCFYEAQGLCAGSVCAPWRSDGVILCERSGSTAAQGFVHRPVEVGREGAPAAPVVRLGARTAPAAMAGPVLEFPFEHLPAIGRQWPTLFTAAEQATPLVVAEPAFARWEPVARVSS